MRQAPRWCFSRAAVNMPVAKPANHFPDDDMDVLNAAGIELALLAIRRLLFHDPLQQFMTPLVSVLWAAMRPANRAFPLGRSVLIALRRTQRHKASEIVL